MTVPATALVASVAEVSHHCMETGVLNGIKERAERALQDAHEG